MSEEKDELIVKLKEEVAEKKAEIDRLQTTIDSIVSLLEGGEYIPAQ